MLLLRVIVFVTLLASSRATDVIWYIAPNGSTNASSCGRTLSEPCASLELVISHSEFFSVDGLCATSAGATDDRRSTTIYFMGGVNFVPSVCLAQWTNLRIVGLGEVSLTSRVGGSEAFFQFMNCSNVTIENVHFLSTFIGRAVLYVQDTRDFSITNSSIPVTKLASRGIQLDTCSGPISITNVHFFGDLSLVDRSNPATALHISLGDVPSAGLQAVEGSVTVYDQADIIIQNCTFTDFASSSVVESTSYTSAWSSSLGVLMRMYAGAVNNTVLFEDCTFTNVQNPSGSVVLAYFGDGATGNTVSFTSSVFLNNQVLYGGGIATYFVSSESNLVEIDGCNFTNNVASFEGGGLFVASLTSVPSNIVSIRDCTFAQNRAEYGSCVFLFNDPSWFKSVLSPPLNETSLPLMTVELADCTIDNSSSSLREGAINTLRIKLDMSGNK